MRPSLCSWIWNVLCSPGLKKSGAFTHVKYAAVGVASKYALPPIVRSRSVHSAAMRGPSNRKDGTNGAAGGELLKLSIQTKPLSQNPAVVQTPPGWGNGNGRVWSMTALSCSGTTFE